MTIYLDCNATTPIEPEVLDVLIRYLRDEYGNSGSRTHEFGLNAKKAVERAREQVAAVVQADPHEVIFTSGATESNNLALLGLAEAGRRTKRMHLISTTIEHKAVLEPLEQLSRLGFEVTLVPPSSVGRVDPADIAAAMRPDTLLVSVMHVNNETGAIQPIAEIADALSDSEAYFHTDAAQGFGKEPNLLRIRRIDLISVSGHKIYGPKGVGALIARRRGGSRAPLSPLLFGGGQEGRLRPGTLPVALIAALGEASRLASQHHAARSEVCWEIYREAVRTMLQLGATINGAPETALGTTLNVRLPGIDSEAAMVALKGIIAISNGAACTSASYERSHVLTAMGLTDDAADCSIRISWSHLTPPIPWTEVYSRLNRLL